MGLHLVERNRNQADGRDEKGAEILMINIQWWSEKDLDEKM